MGGPWQIAQSLRRLGQAAREQDDLDRATALLEEAVERFAAIGVRRGPHWAATNLGQISLQRGDLSRARQWFSEAVTLSLAVHDRRWLAVSFEGAAATLSAGADAESPAVSGAIAR